MPKIPDVRSISEATINVQTPIARVDVSDAGRGLAVVGDALERRRQLQDKNEYNKAKIQFEDNYAKLMTSFDKRTDYKKFDADYQDGIKQAIDQTLDKIENPRLREQFQQEAQLRMIEGRSRIEGLALNQEKDTERAALFDNLNVIETTAVESKEADLPNVMSTAIDALDTAVELGYMTRQERAKSLKGFQDNVAVLRIKRMKPEERIEALKGAYADKIPIEQREQLLRDAENELKESQAIDIVDEYIDKGLSKEEARERSSNIQDDVLRIAVEDRFRVESARRDVIHVERQKQLRDTYATAILESDTFDIANIPDEEWNEMDYEVKASLTQLYQQKQTKTLPKETDPALLIELAVLNGDGKYKEMASLISANSHKMKPSDVAKYSKMSIEGQVSPDIDDGLTLVQRVNGKLTQMEITDTSAKSKILNQVGDWRVSFQKRNGKSPTDEDERKFIDGLLMEAVTDYGVLWDSKMRIYAMGDEDIQSAIEEATSENADVMNTVIEFYRKREQNPTNREILQTYQRLLEQKQGG